MFIKIKFFIGKKFLIDHSANFTANNAHDIEVLSCAADSTETENEAVLKDYK